MTPKPLPDHSARPVYDCAHNNARYAEPCDRCPAEIERLTDERDRLAEALREIADTSDADVRRWTTKITDTAFRFRRIARAALDEQRACQHEGNWDQTESGAYRCEECDELVSDPSREFHAGEENDA